jgi:hypothetical protein
MPRLQRQERNFTLLRRHVVGVSRSASLPRYPTARSVENGERCSLVSSQAQLADGMEVARHIKYIGQLSYESKRSNHTTAAPSSNCVDLEAPVVVRPGRSRQPKLHSADILEWHAQPGPRDFADSRNFDAANANADIECNCTRTRLSPQPLTHLLAREHPNVTFAPAIARTPPSPPTQGTHPSTHPHPRPPPPCPSSTSPTCAHICKTPPKRASA